ncbi:MAG: Ig-like domain-containing protein, partial [Methanobacteriaceae archaeon]|nr:Ig-like domain-containing protein [Methanobacteriaceae archaeon]
GFVVKQIMPEMSISTKDIDYRENETITVSLPADAKGVVTFYLDGAKIGTVNVTDGSASITVPGLEVDKYHVKAVYFGDRNYKSKTVYDGFVVKPIMPEMEINVEDIDYRENETVGLTLPADAKGFVNYFINGKYYKTVPVIKGDASITIPGLEAGEYTIGAYYFGDRNYKPGFVNDTFIVNQIDPECTVTVENITYHENETVTVTVPEDAKGNVTFFLNGEEITVPLDGNEASTVFSGLGAGTYSGTYTYNGDRNYKPFTGSFEFVVAQATPEVTATIENISYHEDGILIVNVNEDATGTVTVIVDDIPYEATIENGVAIVTIPGLQAGDHIAYVIYNGDQNYTNGTTEATFNVAKIDPTIKVDVVSGMHVSTIVEGDDVIVTVTLPEDATGTVKLSIDGGKTWVYADVIDGIAHYTFKGLKAGEYTLLVEYSGDNNYNGISTETTFVVEEAPIPAPAKETLPATGNPILVLLIALCAVGLESFRRKL